MSVTRIVGVEVTVAGYSKVDEALLARRLGPSAWHVWQVLEKKRDRAGVTHITVEGIARVPGFTKIRYPQVRRALRLLLVAGLIENKGWLWKMVPVTKARKEARRVFVRCVRGARLLSTREGTTEVAIPKEVRDWVMRSKRGGARPGAGRKSVLTRLEEERANTPSGSDAAGNSNPCHQNSNPCHQNGIQTRAGYLSLKSDVDAHGKLGVTEFSKKRIAPGRAGAGLLRFPEDETDLGTVLGARRVSAPTPPMMSTPLRGVPPYPGQSIISAAEIPAPQLLTPDLDETARINLIASFYRGAIEKQYRTKCYLFAKGVSAKHCTLFARAASLLAEYAVAPAAWCTWAVRRWYSIKTHTGGWKEGTKVPLPPVGYVLSAKGIMERCEDPEKRYVVTDSACGGGKVFGRVHRKLLERYAEMRRVINTGAPRAQVVTQFFPGSSYEEMVDAARSEAVQIRSRLEDDMKRGKIIW